MNHRTKESYLGVDRSIILKYILDKYKPNLWTGLEGQVGAILNVCAPFALYVRTVETELIE
jgi:hypothetical protein